MTQTELMLITAPEAVKPKKKQVFTEEQRLKRRQQNVEWVKRNLEKRKAYLKEYLKSYRKNNAKILKKKAKRWHDAKLLSLRLSGQSRKIANPERDNEYSRQWKRRNRLKANIHGSKRRAILKTASTASQISSAKRKMAKLKSVEFATCEYCNFLLPINSLHFDHIYPISRGGSHSAENITLACIKCNLSKGARILGVEWIAPKLRNQK